jgi:two-component system, chemotaxis family, chemotaxis protein CheY
MSLPTGSSGHGSTPPTVLIVEDDAATRRLYKFLLSNGGYTVLEAEDGQAAAELLERQECGLVITDMNMPRMDGMELIKHIRRTYADLYVILITAFGTPDTEKNAMRNGANEYLAKPFEFDELEARVRAYFQSRAQSVR